MPVPAEEWLALLEREYLAHFVTAGGAAVKFVAGDDRTITRVQQYLRETSGRHDMAFVAIDAAASRLHMIQDVFFAVARALDWNALAQRFVETLFARNRYEWPAPGQAVPMQELASANRIDISLLRREIQRWLTEGIMGDSTMTQDFRVAMARMCLSRMEQASAEAAIELPIVEWLRGTLRAISALKSAPITAKITRTNGRPMLRSACQWLRKCGKGGLCLSVDIRQLGKGGKSLDNRLRYSPGAVMDGFEVLRQLIDDAEHFTGMLLVALADDALTGSDPTRSLDAYRALKMRIWSDVRPEDRDDPLAPLVQLADSPVPQQALADAPQ